MEKCDVCGVEDPRCWSNRPLLGSADKLCWRCFQLWYEYGVTDREEMRRRSLDPAEELMGRPGG